jgi:hypothetical protein
VKFDENDTTTTKRTGTETFYLTYCMIPTRKKGKRQGIFSNCNNMHYFKISTKGIVGLNRNNRCQTLTEHEQH